MFRVYIDEAGDRGHSATSSTHFIVAAVIVRDEYDAVLRAQLTTLRTALGRAPGHTLHFRKLTHSQKLKASQENASFSLDAITSVTMVKPRFAVPNAEGETPYIKQPDPMYLWAVRLLLERVSWYIGDHGGGPTIVTFAHLTRFPATKLNNYRQALEYSNTQICWQMFEGHQFRQDHPNNLQLLQVADSCASALFKAVEPDDYGNTEDPISAGPGPKLYRRGTANVASYDLKVFPPSETKKDKFLEFLTAF